MKTHPFTTVAVIAGIAFVGGTVLGSRVARGLIVAVAPVVAHRLLDGPLGDELVRLVGGGAARRHPSQHSPTHHTSKGDES